MDSFYEYDDKDLYIDSEIYGDESYTGEFLQKDIDVRDIFEASRSTTMLETIKF